MRVAMRHAFFIMPQNGQIIRENEKPAKETVQPFLWQVKLYDY